MADIERQAEQWPWVTPKEVAERIIAPADQAGAANLIQGSLNGGGTPHKMFIEQIRPFARDVLRALPAHEVRRMPAAEERAVVDENYTGTLTGS